MVTATRRFIYTRPWLYPKQLAAIFDPARISVIEASTKSGKTVGCLVWALENAMLGRLGQNFWWVAPTYGQSKIAYRRLKSGMPQAAYESNEGELTITLANGAVIWFRSGEKPDSLYGEDVYGLVLEEASRMREEAWHASRTTITATRAPVRIIGNVKGRRNWFWRMARRAEAGEPDMAYHQITAYDAIQAGILSADEVADARRQLPEAVFNELYLAQASDDEGNPFGAAAIRQCIAPLSSNQPVAWGIDLAKSMDYTVLIGLDQYGSVCRFERFQMPWTETMARIRAAVGMDRALVDSTGVGDPILEALQRAGGNYEGYLFSSRSKQQLMEGLALAIQQREVRFPEGPIASELDTFEYVYTRTGVRYSAPEGMYDDCVCALGLAERHRRIREAEQLIIVYEDRQRQISPY